MIDTLGSEVTSLPPTMTFPYRVTRQTKGHDETETVTTILIKYGRHETGYDMTSVHLSLSLLCDPSNESSQRAGEDGRYLSPILLTLKLKKFFQMTVSK